MTAPTIQEARAWAYRHALAVAEYGDTRRLVIELGMTDAEYWMRNNDMQDIVSEQDSTEEA